MRYFFDIYDGDHWARDDIGMICRDDRHARYQAVLALTEMAREQLPSDGDAMLLQVRVRDAAHRHFTVKLDFDTDRPSIRADKKTGAQSETARK